MKPLNNFVNFIVLIRLIIMVLIILPLSPYYYCLNDDKSALLLTNPPPYKPYYRFPDQCPDLKSSNVEISKETLSEEYYKCQSNHIERWRITADHYVSYSVVNFFMFLQIFFSFIRFDFNTVHGKRTILLFYMDSIIM